MVFFALNLYKIEMPSMSKMMLLYFFTVSGLVVLV